MKPGSSGDITDQVLMEVFRERMNLSAHTPLLFDADYLALNKVVASVLPARTEDQSPQGSFSRPFEEEEVEVAKAKL